MQGSSAFISDSDAGEVSKYTITIACECFCNRELVGEVLAQLPDFNGQLIWGAPCTPNPREMATESDLVLVVSDETSLSMAIDRIAAYKQLEQATILLYLQDDEKILAEQIPGLILCRSDLASGLTNLTHALFTPVIPHGLVCIEWVDTRHVLLMDGQIAIAEAYGSEPEAAIETAVARLKEHATGRAILGLQASVLCGEKKLAVRYVHHLVSRCRTLMDKDAALFIGIPHSDWPESEHYEVRLAAKIACSSGLEARL